MFISQPTVEILKKLIKTGDPKRQMPWWTTRPRVFYSCFIHVHITTTVDGRTPANQLRLVVYPNIYTGILHPRWSSPDFWTINLSPADHQFFQVKTHPNHDQNHKKSVVQNPFRSSQTRKTSGPPKKGDRTNIGSSAEANAATCQDAYHLSWWIPAEKFMCMRMSMYV